MKLIAGTPRADALTVGAIAALAALTVTVSHEALGHGGVCLAIGGRVTLLTSSLFHCSVPSGLIDLGGPLTNLAVGLAALAATRVVGAGRPALKLFLILVSAFVGFWEGGYLIKAMLMADGDLYFAWADLVGPPNGLVRGAGVAAGLALWLGTAVFATRSLSLLAGEDARRLRRIVWLAATTATVGAAVFYRGGPGPNLRDAFLEIGAASLPLLLIRGWRVGDATPAPIGRRWGVVLLAVAVWVVFVLTQGRGLGA
jgi:hypothetical protein